jgi:sulfatase modifying factor 1
MRLFLALLVMMLMGCGSNSSQNGNGGGHDGSPGGGGQDGSSGQDGSGMPDAAMGGMDGAPGDGGSGDAASLPPASCVGLPKNCGANGDDNCCNSLEVPGGTYYRSYDVASDPNSGNMDYPATVSDFRLDKYEVTVGRFRAFVQAGMGTQLNPPPEGAGAHSKIAGSGWDSTSWNAKLAANKADLIADIKTCFSSTFGDNESKYSTWTDTPTADTENRPMNCITVYEATAFCIWDGGYLPTEAEWNYAAAGGDQQRAYPWSNPFGSLTIDSSYASYNDGMNCVGDGNPGCAVTDLVKVGSKPAGDGRWGQSDLGGNAWEWTLDEIAPYLNPCMDCARLPRFDRIVRGGSFGRTTFFLRTVNRASFPSGDRVGEVGVRCARAP